MTDLDRDCLRMLRIFGPVSNAAVARRLGEKPGRTYRALYRLCGRGLAVHAKRAAWDISAKGRRWFEGAGARPLELFRGGER